MSCTLLCLRHRLRVHSFSCHASCKNRGVCRCVLLAVLKGVEDGKFVIKLAKSYYQCDLTPTPKRSPKHDKPAFSVLHKFSCPDKTP